MPHGDQAAGSDRSRDGAATAAERPAADARRRFLDRALSLGVTEGRALEVGEGGIVRALVERAPRLDATAVGDPVPSAASGSPRPIRLVRGDPKRLPFRDASFDLIVCDALLHRLSAILPALNEMYRALRPGGALLVRDVARPTGTLGSLAAAWRARGLRDGAPNGAPTRALLADLLERSVVRGAALFDERGTHVGFTARRER